MELSHAYSIADEDREDWVQPQAGLSLSMRGVRVNKENKENKEDEAGLSLAHLTLITLIPFSLLSIH